MPLNLAAVPEKREPEIACFGKARLETWAQAEKMARRMNRAKTTGLKPYRCPFCEGWHVGRVLRRP